MQRGRAGEDTSGDAAELEHHGDASEGDSGGPFFSFWPDGSPYVVGTMSSYEVITGGIFGIGDEENNVNAGGAAMVNLIKWGLANWT